MQPFAIFQALAIMNRKIAYQIRGVNAISHTNIHRLTCDEYSHVKWQPRPLINNKIVIMSTTLQLGCLTKQLQTLAATS